MIKIQIYFTMQKYNRQKIPSRYHNSITNLKFQHKPKYHISKLNPHKIKIDLLLFIT